MSDLSAGKCMHKRNIIILFENVVYIEREKTLWCALNQWKLASTDESAVNVWRKE